MTSVSEAPTTLEELLWELHWPSVQLAGTWPLAAVASVVVPPVGLPWLGACGISLVYAGTLPWFLPFRSLRRMRGGW